jgi:hypothetical protein
MDGDISMYDYVGEVDKGLLHYFRVWEGEKRPGMYHFVELRGLYNVTKGGGGGEEVLMRIKTIKGRCEMD